MTTTVFRNGSVVADLGSSAPAFASAGPVLVVADGLIRAIGAEAAGAADAAAGASPGRAGARRAQAGRDDDVVTVDLDGGVLAPAFGDGHAHPPQGGLEKLGPAIRGARDVAGVVAAVREWAEAHPEQEWIYGGSYDATMAPGGLFDARWLDAACADRPVVLNSWDYHTVWVNSVALERAGIRAETPEPALGRIARRADGTPLGTLQEPGAVDLLDVAAPGRSHEERVEAIRLATAEYAGLGIAWAQDAWAEPADVEAYLAAAAADALSIRVDLAQRADPLSWRAQRESFVAARDRVSRLAHPLLTANTVKIFVDGIVEGRTAAMLDDYADHPGDRGIANWTEPELRAATIAFDAAGFQLHLHAIGDAANRLALDVFEAVEKANGPRDRRPVIAHVHVLHPDDVARFARLGVVANLQPLWAQNDDVMRALTVPRLGPERSTWQYSLRSLRDSGARLSFGSDWPVTSADWRPAAATAVLRRAPGHPDDEVLLPEQRIALGDVLGGYTRGTAWQSFAENRRGRLAPGFEADLVWLAGDPRTVDPDALPALAVRGTWVAGRRRHAS